MGVGDIAHELKLLFFNGFSTPTPTLSLASQAMLVAARAVPVPQREGDIGGFIAIHRKPHTVLRRCSRKIVAITRMVRRGAPYGGWLCTADTHAGNFASGPARVPAAHILQIKRLPSKP